MPKSRNRRRNGQGFGNGGLPRQPTVPAAPKPKRKILICVPCHSGSPSYNTFVFTGDAAREAQRMGAESVLMLRATDSILVRARDVLLSSFYASDCSDMLFLDSDVAAAPGSFTRLMSHTHDKDGRPVEVVGGVYTGRGDPPDFVLRTLGRSIDVQYPSGLAEVAGAATGFLRITRSAVDKLLARYGDDWYEDHTAPGLRIYHLFDFEYRRDTRQLFSEDYVFCERLRAVGVPIFVDVGLTLHHQGTKIWTGNFGEFLRGGGNKDNPISIGAPAGPDGKPIAPADAPATPAAIPLGQMNIVDAARALLDR